VERLAELKPANLQGREGKKIEEKQQQIGCKKKRGGDKRTKGEGTVKFWN